eukprot:766976-Hanusia_phi.AAC.3
MGLFPRCSHLVEHVIRALEAGRGREAQARDEEHTRASTCSQSAAGRDLSQLFSASSRSAADGRRNFDQDVASSDRRDIVVRPDQALVPPLSLPSRVLDPFLLLQVNFLNLISMR